MKSLTFGNIVRVTIVIMLLGLAWYFISVGSAGQAGGTTGDVWHTFWDWAFDVISSVGDGLVAFWGAFLDRVSNRS